MNRSLKLDVLSELLHHLNVNSELAIIFPVWHSNKIAWLAALKAEQKCSSLGNCLLHKFVEPKDA